MKDNNYLIDNFNLPSYIKGKSFAEASKAIEDRFKERKDKVSLDTKQELLERLSSAQEFTKEFETSNTFSEGGVASPPTTPGINGYLGLATGALDFGNQLFGKSNIDTTGNSRVTPTDNTVGNIAKGAKAGMIFGPLGAGIGAGVGAITGIIGSKKNKDAANKANHNNTLMQNANYSESDFAKGGYTNNYPNGGLPDFEKLFKSPTGNVMDVPVNSGAGYTKPSLYTPGVNLNTQTTLDASKVDNNTYNGPLNADTFAKHQRKEKINDGIKKVGQGIKKGANWLGDNYGSILRYAPIVGNLTDKLEKPTTQRGSRLDNVYTPQLFDESRLVNQVNQNNMDKALTESSGGDLGALRSNLIGSNLAKLKATSDAYFKGNEVNRKEYTKQFEAGMQKDRTNVMLDNDFLNRQAADMGAYNTAKSAKRSALFEDIGKVGKEETYKKMVKERFGYTWSGKYWVDKDGKKVEDSIVKAKIKSQENEG